MIFAVLFGLTLFAEVLANDKPLLVRHNGEYYTPSCAFIPKPPLAAIFRPKPPIATPRCNA